MFKALTTTSTPFLGISNPSSFIADTNQFVASTAALSQRLPKSRPVSPLLRLATEFPRIHQGIQDTIGQAVTNTPLASRSRVTPLRIPKTSNPNQLTWKQLAQTAGKPILFSTLFMGGMELVSSAFGLLGYGISKFFFGSASVMQSPEFQTSATTLGLDSSVMPTLQKVKKAYRQCAINFHPDKGGSDAAMTACNTAYEYFSKLLKS